MTRINLSGIATVSAKYRYSVAEIVDDFLRDKIERDVRDYVKSELGIGQVYKAYDFSKIDFSKGSFVEPDERLDQMYLKSAKKSMKNDTAENIGMLITVNDNQQFLEPAPTVELIPKLGLQKHTRTQNFQGLACSSLSESILSSAGFFLLDGKKDSLVLIGSFYTPWFLDRVKQIKKISKKTKASFYNLVYFLIFSDIVGSVIISPKMTRLTQIQIESNHILTLKDTNKTQKSTVKLSPDKKHRMIFDMNLQPSQLKNNVTDLSFEAFTQLKNDFPDEFKKIRLWGMHTAGKPFVESVAKKCGISESKLGLTYELMNKSGNTGAVSSLQFLKECKKQISKNETGCFLDYGWEGANAFIFRMV